MIKILLTGYSGFVGSKLTEYLNKEKFEIINFDLRSSHEFLIPDDIHTVIHLAGKAHDIKNISNPADYFAVNCDLTKKVFDLFCESGARNFIFISSIKAVSDKSIDLPITEDFIPNPDSIYGKSKLCAENYLLNNIIPFNKKVFILRPTLIHGVNNKGNLMLLNYLVDLHIPWIFSAFENRRSLCTVDNLLFVINEFIVRDDINSGIYNICDDDPISSTELVRIIAEAKGVKIIFVKIPQKIILLAFRVFDLLKLPLNTDMLNKVIGSLEVSNIKIVKELNRSLPYSTKKGLMKTFLKTLNK